MQPNSAFKIQSGRGFFSTWRTPDVALKTVATVRIQADGGSEFMAEFELACQTKDTALYVPPSQSPQMNGAVERCRKNPRA
jgi:hypothetical protein